MAANGHTADAWAAIVQSPFAGSYVAELFWLARDIVETCDRVFLNSDPNVLRPRYRIKDSYLEVHQAVHFDIYRALSDAARIRLLVSPRTKRRDQTAEQYEVQQARTQWLSNVLAGLPLGEVLDPRVRNSLEHFDEYLDNTALRSYRGEIPRPTLLPLDVALGRENALDGFDVGGKKPTLYPLRVYLAEERCFVNCGRRISLETLRKECAGIRDHLLPLLSSMNGQVERGGILIVVTARSFDRDLEEGLPSGFPFKE